MSNPLTKWCELPPLLAVEAGSRRHIFLTVRHYSMFCKVATLISPICFTFWRPIPEFCPPITRRIAEGKQNSMPCFIDGGMKSSIILWLCPWGDRLWLITNSRRWMTHRSHNLSSTLLIGYLVHNTDHLRACWCVISSLDTTMVDIGRSTLPLRQVIVTFDSIHKSPYYML